MEDLKLHGMWASPFCLEVEVSLKLKGIPYQYIEENLQDKSESLLRYNPIYKTVPVLVHHGNPIPESLVILEYIEDAWKEPQLLPDDPYAKARVRFWLNFFYEKLVPPCQSIIVTQGEEQGNAIRESRKQLITLEEGVGKEFPTETLFFHGNSPGLLDVVLGSLWCWIQALEELNGIELVSKETTPILLKRMEAFVEMPVMKEKQPQHGELIAYAQNLREKLLTSKD